MIAVALKEKRREEERKEGDGNIGGFNFASCLHCVSIALVTFFLQLLPPGRILHLPTLPLSGSRPVLSDSESVRWLNHVVEKIWPVCMEQIFSQKILLPIIPWFLQKYKPWTVKKAAVQHLYLGRSPPLFTEMRVLRQSNDDDHLVLELGVNFRTADDMSAILSVKLRKRLGFGMRTKLHLMGMHVEGKVLIGVKFIRHWPFLGRLRVCFAEPPYFQMTVKPIFTHGLDVTELPGIAGWLDKLLALAFEQTLVEPNMLVVNMEKFASPLAEDWFSVDEKEPIGYALVEVVEAADMKPSDLNGLADPYVKGQLGPYRFRTKTQKKTLAPKWHEEFKVPICTWDSPNMLAIQVRDKDHFVDDTLGDCSIPITGLRGGQRRDMWLPLQNIKMGRLHLAITVVEGNRKAPDQSGDNETFSDDNERNSILNETDHRGSLSSRWVEKSPKVADKFEPIDIEGQQETGIWVHHPGSGVSQIWKPRKGRSRICDEKVHGESSAKSTASGSYNNESSSTDESHECSNKGKRPNKVLRGFYKIGSFFHKNSEKDDIHIPRRTEEPFVISPCPNLKPVNAKKIGVKLVVEDNNLSAPSLVKLPTEEGIESPEGSVKDMAKRFLKHAGKSARGVKNAFSRKGSKNSGSEESSDESISSSVCTSEWIPVVPKDLSGYSNDSFKSEELGDQKTPSDLTINVEVPINKVNPLAHYKDNEDVLLVESPKPQAFWGKTCTR
ncbi:acetolactate synthase [Sarracenia purpurea var. burkii]